MNIGFQRECCNNIGQISNTFLKKYIHEYMYYNSNKGSNNVTINRIETSVFISSGKRCTSPNNSLLFGRF